MPKLRYSSTTWSVNFKIYGSFRNREKILTVNDINVVKDIFIRNYKSIGKSFSIYPGSTIMRKILPHLENSDWKRVKCSMLTAFSRSTLEVLYLNIEHLIEEEVISLKCKYLTLSIQSIVLLLLKMLLNKFCYFLLKLYDYSEC